MKIIVTGALGHIGSHLVRRLPDFFPYCEVLMIDNLLTQRYSSLFNLPKKAKYKFIEADVINIDLTKYFKDADVVIQLAAITDAAASFENASEVEKVNFEATKAVANACIEAHCPMIMASSTSVYGTQKNKVDEYCEPNELKPQSPYAETKLKEEDMISKKVLEEGLKAVKFRYGTIFGVSRGMRFHTAVNKFCWQAVMGDPLTVWETAYNQKRPYLDIDDCARAISFTIKSNMFDGRVYNVVSQNATVKEVIGCISKQIPDLKVDFVKHKIMNQLSYEVLNTRMSEAGFKVKYNLNRGIKETINLLRN